MPGKFPFRSHSPSNPEVRPVSLGSTPAAQEPNSEITPQSDQALEKKTQSTPTDNLRCFWFKVKWQISAHPFRSVVLAIPTVAWGLFLSVAGFIQNESGKPLHQWLPDSGLPSLMTLLVIGSAIVLLVTAIVAASIVLPANSELDAIKPLFEKLTPDQKTVLRWILPLGRSPISIPQSDKDELERIYQATAFVTRHTTGHYEVSKDIESRLGLLLKCDEVKQKLWYETAQSELAGKGTKDTEFSPRVPTVPTARLTALGSDKQATINQWREMVASAQIEFKGSALSFFSILQQKPEFKGLKRHLSTSVLEALEHGTGAKSSEHPFRMLDEEITRIEETWGLR